MKKAILAAGLVLGMASGAMAQTVDQRHVDQQQRIGQGIRSGALTSGETVRLEHQQGSIDRQEARMRDRDNGHLTRQDRRILQHRENRASAHIWRAKHNGRVG
ncbi:MAG TPA: hypothetical protein VKQ09_04850 [Sphingomonas sp.]|nr:hypothetical protein [Sphingomonas sp.]